MYVANQINGKISRVHHAIFQYLPDFRSLVFRSFDNEFVVDLQNESGIQSPFA